MCQGPAVHVHTLLPCFDSVHVQTLCLTCLPSSKYDLFHFHKGRIRFDWFIVAFGDLIFTPAEADEGNNADDDDGAAGQTQDGGAAAAQAAGGASKVAQDILMAIRGTYARCRCEAARRQRGIE